MLPLLFLLLPDVSTSPALSAGPAGALLPSHCFEHLLGVFSDTVACCCRGTAARPAPSLANSERGRTNAALVRSRVESDICMAWVGRYPLQTPAMRRPSRPPCAEHVSHHAPCPHSCCSRRPTPACATSTPSSGRPTARTRSSRPSSSGASAPGPRARPPAAPVSPAQPPCATGHAESWGLSPSDITSPLIPSLFLTLDSVNADFVLPAGPVLFLCCTKRHSRRWRGSWWQELHVLRAMLPIAAVSEHSAGIWLRNSWVFGFRRS